jgi:hypothetical protein
MNGTGPREHEHGVAVEMTIPVVRRDRKAAGAEVEKAAQGPPPRPKIPRITRLMALAIKFQDMIDRGEVRDYADIARLGLVTRARLTQIMNLTLLAPDIQEEILRCPAAVGMPHAAERQVRMVVNDPVWESQRLAWRKLCNRTVCHYIEAPK